jgi:hypothetical protein
MDPTSHVPSVKLFHYLIHAMPLTEEEQRHLKVCSYCQFVLDEFDTYINHDMLYAA